MSAGILDYLKDIRPLFSFINQDDIEIDRKLNKVHVLLSRPNPKRQFFLGALAQGKLVLHLFKGPRISFIYVG